MLFLLVIILEDYSKLVLIFSIFGLLGQILVSLHRIIDVYQWLLNNFLFKRFAVNG